MWFSVKINIPAFLKELSHFGDIDRLKTVIGNLNFKDGFLNSLDAVLDLAEALSVSVQWERIKGGNTEELVEVATKALDALLEFKGIAGSVVETVDGVIFSLLLKSIWRANLNKYSPADATYEEKKAAFTDAVRVMYA